MDLNIERVAVLGAGVMGAQLAGHLANAGIPSLLFDVSQELAEKGLKGLTKLKPAPLYDPAGLDLITPCNYGDHLDRLNQADWVLEAVIEDLAIKEKIYKQVLPHLKVSAVISSNTSGIPLSDLVGTLPKAFQKRFLITHFFNPPRYMRLLELVRGPDTTADVYSYLASFGHDRLGKGIVHAKDTPNFIANRIGVYGMLLTLKLAQEMNLTVEEVDQLTGTLVGRPKSATFRTADIVGLDTLVHVARGIYDRGEDDEEREVFQVPAILNSLVEEGRLGQKSGAGFYKKEDKTILSLDLESGEYDPRQRVRLDGYRLARDHQQTGAKISALAYSDDRGGRFFWELLSRTLIYTAHRIPEISDDIVNIDNALKWGFGWELGPFETWDALGVDRAVERMGAEGKKVPSWIEKMLASGHQNFYQVTNGTRTYYDLPSAAPRVEAVESIRLSLEKSKGNLIQRHWSASLIDLGEGVLDVEFHSILQPGLNPLDGSMLQILNQGLDLLEAGQYRALVIGHQGQNFCAGANLAAILLLCENRDWTRLEDTVKAFQELTQRIRFAKAPVVAAPFQLTLGGGFEFIAPAAHRVASAETYIGAVEVGVGLIPGAGGNLRLLMNLMENTPGRINPFQIAQKAFETIGFAKVSRSAAEAKSLGYLLASDTVVLNEDQRLGTAREKALELIEGYSPPTYRDDLKLPGLGGRTAMLMALKGLKAQGKISAHDEVIAKKLAFVITGGKKGGLTKKVDEQYLLDIEREAFVSLAGEPLSQERIRHMLKKGKPLRN